MPIMDEQAILTLENISKSFGALKASDEISLDLCASEIHALIGPNGAGKSTLVNQIAGAIKPDTGKILFLGQDITASTLIERARMGLGRSFQVSAIIPEFDVLKNIMLALYGYGNKQATKTSVYQFLKSWKNENLIEQAQYFAEKTLLSDRLNVQASNLAHGEKRRLELAMALALNPKALLLDEPLAGMGTEGVNEVSTLLEELKNDTPILLIEHDMDAVFRLADRISVLVYGKIIATDTVDNIRNNPKVQKAYLGEQGD